MAEPPEFARYGEKCPRTGGEHRIGKMSARCRHCNGKAIGWTWARVDAAQKAEVALPYVMGPAPFADPPPTRNDLSLSPIAVPEGHRVETYFTNASINGNPQTVSWSKPSAPDTWDAAFDDGSFLAAGARARAFMDPTTTGEYDEKRGWQPPGAAAQSVAPSRARLTCDRNGLEPGNWDREQELRAASNTVLDAANRHVAKLNERIAVLEADNKVLEARKDAVLDQYAAASTVAMRLSHRVLTLQVELDALKRHQSPHLPEPEKSSQDAVWRNATRFSR